MTDPIAAPRSSRLASLDAFRGFDIALMFFVNLSGNREAFPAWFGHAGWNDGGHGQWLADYVFPWFLFIVGVAIPFSMNSGRGANLSRARRLLAALRRGTLIYLLGVLIWVAKSSPDGSVWRDGALAVQPGTPISWGSFLHWDILPLIGLGYTLAVAACLLPAWGRAGLVAVILAGKALALPDLAATDGLERAAWMATRTDLDAAIRGWGWWGTMVTQGLPATTTVILGTLAGDLLRRETPRPGRRAWMLIGTGVGVTAFAAAWSLRLPISKDFFTPTYVLISCGTGAAALGVFYGVLDAWRWSRRRACVVAGVVSGAAATISLTVGNGWFTPHQAASTAVVLWAGSAVLLATALWDTWRKTAAPARWRMSGAMGCNAIAIYVLAELAWTLVWMRWRVACPGDYGPQVAFAALQVHFRALTRPIFGESLAAGLGPWLASLAYIGLYAALAAWLYRKKIFIKV